MGDIMDALASQLDELKRYKKEAKA